MDYYKEKFDELVIQAKQVGFMRDLLSSDEATEEEGLGMTDEEFYDFQEQYFNLMATVREGAKSIYPESLFSYANARLSQLGKLKEDENADHVDIENEENAINMLVGFWKPEPTVEDVPTE